MKKLLVLLTITCMSLGLHAQSYLGIKAGGGMSVLGGNVNYTHEPGLSFGGGLSYKHQIYKRVALEGDVLFDLRSTVVPEYSGGSISAMYITMPLTIQWQTPFTKRHPIPSRTSKSKSFYFVEGGLNLGLGMNGTTYVAGATGGGGFDLGLAGGIGVNLANENNMNRWNIGLRGSYGFLNYNIGVADPAFNYIVGGAYIAYDFKLGERRYYQYSM